MSHKGHTVEARAPGERHRVMGCLKLISTWRTSSSSDTSLFFTTVSWGSSFSRHDLSCNECCESSCCPSKSRASACFSCRPTPVSHSQEDSVEFPQILGEEQFVMFLGGMHVDMTAFRFFGNWLGSSGWTTIINSGVAAGGTADSLLAVSLLGKTKYTHKVTAATQFVLMDRAYQEYVSSTPVDEVKEISARCKYQMADHPQFQYWCMVLNLELLVLSLVGSIRSGDFQQCMKSIQELIPWSFAMDHIN